MNGNKLAVYQNDQGAIELSIDATNETIWASQSQIADLFEVTPQNITLRLKTIYSDGELEELSTCKDSLQVQKEGSREVNRSVKVYNLDAILAIGYKIGSGKGTEFRKWATKTLNGCIIDGYAINPARIEHNKSQFLKALDDMKSVLMKFAVRIRMQSI